MEKSQKLLFFRLSLVSLFLLCDYASLATMLCAIFILRIVPRAWFMIYEFCIQKKLKIVLKRVKR